MKIKLRLSLEVVVFVLLVVGVVWAGVMPCERIYEYASDDELKLDLLDNERSLEGPEVRTLTE